MKQIVLNITQTEYEILTHFGVVSSRPDEPKETFNVTFGFPSYLTMDELVENLDRAIAFQESDQGDWLRAQEWKKAKPGLMDKVRRAYLTLVRET